MTVFSLESLQSLEELSQKISSLGTIEQKYSFWEKDPKILKFFENHPTFWKEAGYFSKEEKNLFLTLIHLEQENLLFPLKGPLRDHLQKLSTFLQEIDSFYGQIGGIVGYHCLLISLTHSQFKERKDSIFHQPSLIDISEYNERLSSYLHEGLAALPHMAEFYPLGGAADRLHLQEEGTGKELPAAKLTVGGKTLLERLIEDLIAREYLYYKLYNRQVHVPVIIMTSHAKDNHRHICTLLEEKSWFFRDKDHFHIMIQPQVPAITEEGKWAVGKDGLPLQKPSGHGVLWKLTDSHHLFDFFIQKKIKKGIVRQINNPLAGLDYNLLLLAGYGFTKDQTFGFFCTKRKKEAAEGAIVLTQKDDTYCLTNIEYCDFLKRNIDPTHFPSNTNILFVDIERIKEAVQEEPFPGLLVNWKKATILEDAKEKEKKVARLESTMQNIADQFTELGDGEKKSMKKSFAIYHDREKIISTAKKVYHEENDGLESPERCFYDLQYAAWDLFQNHCQMELPDWPAWQKYKQEGAPCYFSYHPALGPLYEVIAQKIEGGIIHRGSECYLSIAELYCLNLELDGSLYIEAKDLCGHLQNNQMIYSCRSGKCTLKNVKIKSEKGKEMDFHSVWKSKSERKGLSIVIHGNGEFHAEDVTFEGSFHFEVKENRALYVTMKGGRIETEEKEILEPTWLWEYRKGEKGEIRLLRKLYDHRER